MYPRQEELAEQFRYQKVKDQGHWGENMKIVYEHYIRENAPINV